jgi:hypothetical protein
MGWLYTQGQTRRELITHLCKAWQHPGASYQTLAHCAVGNTLWAVHEIYRADTGHFMRFISCYLMQTHRGFGWGYKAMEESCHPYYYSCPEKYLQMTPQVACPEWREAVLEHHIRRRERNQRRRQLRA